MIPLESIFVYEQENATEYQIKLAVCNEFSTLNYKTEKLIIKSFNRI